MEIVLIPATASENKKEEILVLLYSIFHTLPRAWCKQHHIADTIGDLCPVLAVEVGNKG